MTRITPPNGKHRSALTESILWILLLPLGHFLSTLAPPPCWGPRPQLGRPAWAYSSRRTRTWGSRGTCCRRRWPWWWWWWWRRRPATPCLPGRTWGPPGWSQLTPWSGGCRRACWWPDLQQREEVKGQRSQYDWRRCSYISEDFRGRRLIYEQNLIIIRFWLIPSRDLNNRWSTEDTLISSVAGGSLRVT